jgi:HYR domain
MKTYSHSKGRLLGRLLLLAGLLVGLGLLTGELATPAHAATTLTVSTCDEPTLDSAISNAASGDTITFGCSGTITLSQTLVISKNLTLDGSGQAVTLDGQNQVKVLTVNRGVSFTLNALTIAHGSASGSNGGGLDNKGGTVSISNSTFANNSDPTGGGGGLYNDIGGTVSISNSTVANNSSPSSGGGLGNNRGTVSISNSTFSGNSAGDGSGLDTFEGTVSISNSTFANNSASGSSGGGLYNNQGTVSISNSTFANNSATGVQVGGLSNNQGTMSIRGSIVANNTGGNCFGGVSDQGYNLDSDGSCGFTGTGDLQNTNPQLDPNGLQNNGGPTQTIALQSTSPAIDQIPVASCPATDQRGNSRPDDAESMCDMGAYESSYPPDNDLALTNVPSGITVNATSPQGAVVAYTPPTVADEDTPLPPVNCTPASGSTFAMGTTTVTCTVSDSDDTNSPVSQSFTVTVNPVLSVSVSSVNATEGSAFSGVVATGTAYGSSTPLTATITWGDGSSSTVSVTPNPDSSYSVSGSHTYAEEGSYALSVSVKDSGSLSATGNGSATVADAALSLTHFVAGPLKHLYAGVVATFTDADPNGTVSDYTATVTWGDGSTSTVNVYKNPLGQGFVLAGLHHYAKTGTYTVTLTVSDSGGSQISKTVAFTVK